MKQTVEEAAKQELISSYAIVIEGELVYQRQAMLNMFKKGADWQSKQSPWISVKERLPEEGQRVVFILEWRGIHRGYFAGLYKKGKWETEERVYDTISFHGIVIYYMPIPSLDEILEANRDVLERIKQKGD